MDELENQDKPTEQAMKTKENDTEDTGVSNNNAQKDAGRDYSSGKKGSSARVTMGAMKQITNLVTGFVLLGSEQFAKTLQNAQQNIESSEDLSTSEYIHADEDEITQVRYLIIGSLNKVQKGLAKRTQKGIQTTVQTSGTLLSTFYALTDNPFLRPIRKPVDKVLSEVARNVDQTLREGREEEVRSKALAKETTDELMDQVMAYVSHNPEMANMIQDIVGSQSLGMVKMIMDGVADRTAYYDAMIESFVRKVLHLTPRAKLPPSPIAGKRQYMYLPEGYAPDEDEI